jgi:hypothetical protein
MNISEDSGCCTDQARAMRVLNYLQEVDTRPHQSIARVLKPVPVSKIGTRSLLLYKVLE